MLGYVYAHKVTYPSSRLYVQNQMDESLASCAHNLPPPHTHASCHLPVSATGPQRRGGGGGAPPFMVTPTVLQRIGVCDRPESITRSRRFICPLRLPLRLYQNLSQDFFRENTDTHIGDCKPGEGGIRNMVVGSCLENPEPITTPSPGLYDFLSLPMGISHHYESLPM